MHALKRHTLLEKLSKGNQERQLDRLFKRAFIAIHANITLSRHERDLKSRSETFRAFNLKIKAWTVLMQYFGENDTRFYSN